MERPWLWPIREEGTVAEWRSSMYEQGGGEKDGEYGVK
jgi:hypothetical protein